MQYLKTIRSSIAVLTVLCAFSLVGGARADMIYVDDDAPNDPGPGDVTVSDPLEDGSAGHPFDAIQEGIDAAVDDDEVVVLDGTYTGAGNRDMDFGGRLITVRSENGPEACIIDCQGSASEHHRAFGFFDGETAEAVVEGLTIRNGIVESRGAAITCGGGSGPTILNCVITGNVAGNRGGGIYCDDASNPVLINCTIRGNSVEYRGAGVSCDHDSSPTMLNCLITGNVADYRGGGVYCDNNSNPVFINSVVSGNTAATRGSGIYCDHASNATIINSTVSANTGGGDGICLDHYSSPTITNSIIWGNTSLEIRVLSGDPVITFSDIGGGWPGEGNIDADPLFVDPDGPDDDPATWEENDYRLSSGSPCIDAADNTAVPPDVADLDGDGNTVERTPLDLGFRPRFMDDTDTEDTGVADPPDYPEVVDMGAYEYRRAVPALDIKPGSCPNSFDRHSHGVLPVALLGTADIDAMAIDVSSILLARADGIGGSVAPHEGPPGPHSVFEDVATPFDGDWCDCHDLEGDGITDLMMHFKTDDVVDSLQLSDLDPGALVELVVSGNLLDGTAFTASDCIRLVPPGTAPGQLYVESTVPGAWIDVSPPDETLDGGGFADFERTYPLSTVVTLTAGMSMYGQSFMAWRIDGVIQELGENTIQLVIDGNVTVEAAYGRAAVPMSPGQMGTGAAQLRPQSP